MESILTHFLLSHHLDKSEETQTLFTALEDALLKGSSCLNLQSYCDEYSIELESVITLLQPNIEGSAVASHDVDTELSKLPVAPLILYAGTLLYYHRYFYYESSIADKLLTLSSFSAYSKSSTEIRSQVLLKLLFQEDQENPEDKNLQEVAASIALDKNLLILSGGPGTGKTTTVVKILALLHHEKRYINAEEVLLIAPTGKAANRLSESIQSGKEWITQKLSKDSTIHNLSSLLEALPTESSTIHRAIGLGGSLKAAKYNQSNPLPQKVIVIDEASMIDLTLMHQLFLAINKETIVIILGDQNQLASIQVGTVMADLIEIANTMDSSLSDCHVHLVKTYRNSGTIKAACDAIAKGDSNNLIKYLTASPIELNTEIEINTALKPLPSDLLTALTPLVETHWIPILNNKSASDLEKIQALEKFKILCPTRSGRYGLDNVNRVVEHLFQQAGIKQDHQYYMGKTVMVTKNNHDLGIYNGDIGILVPMDSDHSDNDPTSIHYGIFFDKEHITAPLSVALFPEMETAWALTIHKTQGSEYENTLIILSDQESAEKTLSRELIYTGISRAKSHATVWADVATLKLACQNTIQRASGIYHHF